MDSLIPQIAIPSTDNPEEDKAALDRALLIDARIAANLCPNGCAALVRVDDYARQCPACGFRHWSNQPHEVP